MSVVSVRLDDADQEWIVRHGHKPGTFAREAVHEAIQRAEMRRSAAWLAANAVEFGDESSQFFRRERDGRAKRSR